MRSACGLYGLALVALVAAGCGGEIGAPIDGPGSPSDGPGSEVEEIPAPAEPLAESPQGPSGDPDPALPAIPPTLTITAPADGALITLGMYPERRLPIALAVSGYTLGAPETCGALATCGLARISATGTRQCSSPGISSAITVLTELSSLTLETGGECPVMPGALVLVAELLSGSTQEVIARDEITVRVLPEECTGSTCGTPYNSGGGPVP